MPADVWYLQIDREAAPACAAGLKLRRQACKRGAEVQTLRLDMQVGAALLPVLPGHRGLTLLALSHGPPFVRHQDSVNVHSAGLAWPAAGGLQLLNDSSVIMPSLQCAGDACSPAFSGANSTESWRPSSRSWSRRACSARPPGTPDVLPPACGGVPSSLPSPVSRSCGHPLSRPAPLCGGVIKAIVYI